MNTEISLDEELRRLQRALDIFREAGDPAAQRRMLIWVVDKLGLDLPAASSRDAGRGRAVATATSGTGPMVSLASFATSAELLARAGPLADEDKVLVIAAHLQEVQGMTPLTGFLINRELRDLGHRVKNVTRAIGRLSLQKPALMVQLRKSGTQRQARKTYKVTIEGIAYVERMIKQDRGNQ